MTSAKQKLRELLELRKRKAKSEIISANKDNLKVKLSYGQQRFWFLNQFLGPNAIYNMPIALRLHGKVNESALIKSLVEIVNRHDVLRTKFIAYEESAIQVVESDEIMLQVETINSEQELKSVSTGERNYAFDLSKDRLCRIKLLHERDTGDYILLVTMHHSISDGWSLSVFNKELVELYLAFNQGKPSPLSRLPIQYADFSRWQRRRLTGEILENSLAHWREQLKDLPPLLNLPTDKPRPIKQSFRGRDLFINFSQDLTKQLISLSQKHGVTLYISLLSALSVLLGRYAGQLDVAIGSPVANRNQPETEGLIGFFANTLVMRSDLSGNPTFADLIRVNHQLALKNYQYQELPFEQLVEELNPERSLSHSPLFQVMFSLQNIPKEYKDLHDLDITRLFEEKAWKATKEESVSRFDLTLNLIETKQGLRGKMEFNLDLFEETTIERMLTHLKSLLETIVKAPESPVLSLDFLTKKEKSQQLVDWNQTQRSYSKELSIHQLFEQQAKNTPQSIAVVYENKQVSYEEINRRANQLAYSMIGLGVGPQMCIGLCVERSIEMLVGLLGILKAGGCYVPLDPKYPKDRLAYIVEHSGIELIVTQPSVLESLNITNILKSQSKPEAKTRELRSILIDQAVFSYTSSYVMTNPENTLQPTNLAYVIYTSGSTGNPKGVGITHQNAVNFLLSMQKLTGLSTQERLLAVTTLSFDIAVLELLLPITIGAVVDIANNDWLMSGRTIAKRIDSSHISLLQATPVTWQILVNSGWSGNRNLTGLIGGEAVPLSLVKSLEGKVKSLRNMYGPTETTVWSTSQLFNKEVNSVSIGKPIDNTDIYVLDMMQEICPVGVPGELYIGGDGLSQGYFKSSKSTAERFVPNPFSGIPGKRLYRTGDLVRFLSDGRLDYLGRNDHQIKLRGFRIELGEIENILVTHENVRESVAVIREDQPGNQLIVAYVTFSPSGDISGDKNLSNMVDHIETLSKQLIEISRSKLPTYMVPSNIVVLETFPLTTNGKVNRNALPEPDSHQLRPNFEAPKGITEELLVSIWCEVLGCDRVGRLDNFFNLGGHSLLATQVVSRIRDVFAVDLPIRAIFEQQSLSQLAISVQQSQKKISVELSPIMLVDRDESLRLSYSQQRLHFLSGFIGPSAVYNISKAFRIRGNLNQKVLLSSLREILLRHESLRTRFKTLEDNVYQVIDNSFMSLKFEPVSTNSQLMAIYESERNYKFNLADECLTRIRLIADKSDDSFALIVTMHHIVTDGWSLGIFFNELFSIYRAFLENKPSPLAKLSIQYADYAYWQNQCLKGEALKSQLDYWREKLYGLPELLHLPTDRPRPSKQTFSGRAQYISLSAELSRRLSVFCQQHNVTLYMTLLSAFAVLMSRHSGQEDIAIGTPIANRNRKEVEGLIGFFVNSLVIRSNFKGDPSFVEFLQQTRESSLEAYTNQDVPFERLVEELRPKRNLGYTPLYQVMFALQNAREISAKIDELEFSPLVSMTDAEKEEIVSVSRFDLTFNLEERPQGIVGMMEFNSDLFDDGTINRMLKHYQKLLESIIKSATSPVSRLQYLTEFETNLQLNKRNSNLKRLSNNESLLESFESLVILEPDGIAIKSENEFLSFLTLNERANQIAHFLIAKGVDVEIPVGLCLESPIDVALGFLAILKVGGCCVPFLPSMTQSRIEYLLEDSNVEVIITDTSMKEKLSSVLSATSQNKFYRGKEWFNLDDISLYSKYSFTNSIYKKHESNIAAVLYGEEKGGRPKGFTITQQMLSDIVNLWRSTNMLHDDSISEMQNNAGANCFGVLSSIIKPKNDASEKRSSLPFLRNVELLKSYILGKAVRSSKVYLLDNQLQLNAEGVIGELYLSCDEIVGHYVNQTSLTAQSFIPDPFSDIAGARLYRTGYRARFVADGEIELIGTSDLHRATCNQQETIKGLETCLLKSPAVSQVVIVAHESNSNNPLTHNELVCYVVADDNYHQQNVPELLYRDLLEYLRKQSMLCVLPNYWVVLDSLPLTSDATVDLKALPKPESFKPVQFIPPEGIVEELLAGLWCDTLKCKPVGRFDNFFTLGGHSLLATTLVSRICETFSIEFTIGTLFEQQTLQAQARSIELAKQTDSVEVTPIKAVSRDNPLVLSFAQQRLWFLSQYMGPSAVYNIPLELRLRGQLVLPALIQSLTEIVNRHEALRSRFNPQQGEVYQLIDPTPLSLEVETISSKNELKLLRQGERHYLFDLSQDSLCRIRLLRDQSEENNESHILLITMHHSVSDGWSLGILFNELVTLYQAFKNKAPSPLKPLTIQYADYAHWQREWLQGKVLDKQLSYWRTQLSGLPPLLNLPTDRPRPTEQSFRGNTESFSLPQPLSESLRQLSQKQDVTLYMTLLSAFSVLMGRYAGQDDIAIGSPIANRTKKETENLIGFFVNTLVMRSDLSDDPCFIDLLKQTRQSALQGFAHQDIPFEQLVEELSPERSLSYSPLFQVMFSLQNLPTDSVELTELELSPLRLEEPESSEEGVARFDLTLTLNETSQGIVGEMEYNTDLFDRVTIERLLAHYQRLLTAIVERPEARISSYDILSEAEKQQQLVDWNPCHQDYSQDKCIHELFESQVDKNPGAIALTFENTQLSYAELNRRSNQLAHYLIAQGVKPEVKVGLCVERSLEMVLGILGILKAGGAYVPIDPNYPQKRINYLLEDSGVGIIITQSGVADNLQKDGEVATQQLVWLDLQRDSKGNDRILRGQPTVNIDRVAMGLSHTSLAYVIYTSGSTGHPKGVLIEHGNIPRLFYSSALDFNFNQHDTWSLFHSYAFDFSVWEIWGALIYGGRLVVVPGWMTRSPDDFYQLLVDEQVSVLNQTPTMFNQVIEVDKQQQTLDSLRTVIFGGEALETQRLKPWFERHSDQLVQVVNMYGITETTVHVTYRRLYQRDTESASGSVIGKQLSDLQLYLLDSHLSLVPAGVTAEIYVGGAGVARGYLNRDELTRSRFISNPYQPGERLYRTGDLGRYIGNGELEYMGRADQQVKLRGFRIELGEIESVVLAHAQVKHVVVVVREDEPGNKRLVAYFVKQTETPLSEAVDEADDLIVLINELRSYTQSQLPIHMVPSAFVKLETIPLTVHGKVDLKALPSPDLSVSANNYVAPTNDVEQMLCEIWQAELKVERIGIQDNFFSVGGDSILSIRIVAKAKSLGLSISVKDIFQYQTIALLGEQLTTGQLSTTVALTAQPFSLLSNEERASLGENYQAVYEDVYPMSELQLGMVFHTQLDDSGTDYNNVLSFHISMAWNKDYFEQVLGYLFEQNPVLRTGYELERERPLQTVYKAMELPFYYHDISHLSLAAQNELISQWMAKEKTTPFNWQGPLLKVFIHQRTERSFEFSLAHHHAVYDGWSDATFISQVFGHYSDLLAGKTLAPAVADYSFRDFIQLEQQALGNKAAKDYWTSMLSGAPTLQIPRKNSSQETPTQRVTVKHEVAGLFDLSADLIKRAKSLQVPLQSVLLAVHTKVLSILSGESNTLTSYVVNGRPEHEGGEHALGLFLNSLPMCFKLTGANWRGLIESIAVSLADCMAHRHYPSSAIQRDTNRTFSEVLFGYTHFHVYESFADNDEIAMSDFQSFEQTNYDFVANFSRAVGVERLSFSITYDVSVYDAALIERIGGYYIKAFNALLSDVEASYVRCDLFSEAETHRLMYGANQVEEQREATGAVHQLFEDKVNAAPNKIVIAYDGLEEEEGQLSYEALNRQANRVAHYLMEQGVGAEVKVGIGLSNETERLVAILGVLKAGGAFVSLDVEASLERLSYLVEVSDVELILTQASLITANATTADDVVQNQFESIPLVYLADILAIETLRFDNPQQRVNSDSLACVLAKPKAVGVPQNIELTQRNLYRILGGDLFAVSELETGEEQENINIKSDHTLVHLRGLLDLPVVNTKRYIFNHQGELAPIGSTGELYLGGEGVYRAYENQSSETAQYFVPDHLNATPGQRLYRTGLLARYLENGELELVKRKVLSDTASPNVINFQVIAQIEHCLLQHEQVTEVVSVSLAATDREAQLVSFLVLKGLQLNEMEEHQLSSELLKQLKAESMLMRLPNTFVVIESVPLTSYGQVDEQALLGMLAIEDESYVTPKSETENVLVDIWQAQLGIEKIGTEDNYFVLGGDSIRSISLVAEANKRGLLFSIKDLFNYPTIRALGELLDNGELILANEEVLEIAPFSLLTDKERRQINTSYDEEALEDAYPLSVIQQGMVVLALKYSHLNLYENIQIYEFSDDWDQPLFEQALTYLMDKHPMMKSVHDFTGERPLQLILKSRALNLSVVDVSHKSEQETYQIVNQWTETEKGIGIDTSKELWRVTVHILSNNRFAFGLFLHHALWDGWSLESFVTELYAVYARLRNKLALKTYEKLPQYNQFIVREQAAIDSKANQDYWQAQLQEAELPWWTGKEKSGGMRVTKVFSKATSQKLSSLANRLKVQEKSLWCSVYLTLLSLLNGTDKVVGSVMTQGRPEIPGGEKMVGVFINSLPLQTDLGGQSWESLLQMVDGKLREQHEFRDYPMAEIQRSTGLDFSGAVLNYTHWHVYSEGVSPQTEESAIESSNLVPKKVGGFAETDFLFYVDAYKDDKTQQFGLDIVSDRGVFDEAFRERIQAYILNIVAHLEYSPSLLITKDSLIGQTELEKLSKSLTKAEAERNGEGCIHDLFEAQVTKTPNAIALTFDNSLISYAELNRRANEMANCLLDQNLNPGERVGVYVSRSIDMVIGVIAILKAGGSYVPLDPNYPVQRLVHIIKDSGLNVIVTQTSELSLNELTSKLKDVGLITNHLYLDRKSELSFSGENPRVKLHPSNLAYVIYTSGSTGKPKGVKIEHRNATNFFASMQIRPGITSKDRLFAVTTLSFDIALLELILPLTIGANVDIASRECVLDGNEIAKRIDKCKISILQATPVTWNLLLDSGWQGNKKLKGLIGGEAFSQSLSTQLLDRVASLWNMYGPTESTVWSSIQELTVNSSIDIGRPISNTSAYILDTQSNLCPTSVPGELYLGGDGLSQGYYGRSALTAERFVPDQFSSKPGQRLYRTGDLVQLLADGNMRYLSRLDNQIKLRGFRIELGEIENVISKHQIVKEIVIQVYRNYHEVKHLIAYIVANTNHPDWRNELSKDELHTISEELRTLASKHLPNYMVPQTFMFIESLPLTANNKIDRKALPVPNKDTGGVSYVRPENEVEQKLARIWSNILAIEKVGRFDNFFVLGGNSLLITQLASRVHEVFNIKLVITDLFEQQTLNAQAMNIQRLQKEYDINSSGKLTSRFQNNGNSLEEYAGALEEGEI